LNPQSLQGVVADEELLAKRYSHACRPGNVKAALAEGCIGLGICTRDVNAILVGYWDVVVFSIDPVKGYIRLLQSASVIP